MRTCAQGWEHNDADKERHLIYFDTIVYLTVRSQNENENRDHHHHHTIWWSIVVDNERRWEREKKKENETERERGRKTHLDVCTRLGNNE